MSSLTYRPAMRWLLVLWIIVGAFSVNAADNDKTKNKFGVTKPLGDTYAASTHAASAQVDSSQSLLIIYRAATAKAEGVASLYLDDKYHVALQPNAYSLVCVEADSIQLRTHFTQPEADQPYSADIQHSLPLKKGAAHYIRISSPSDTRLQLDPVPTRIATDELQNARQQMHTLSRARVVRPCKTVNPVKLASAEPNIITFGADANFRSKKVDLKAISPNGKAALGQIIEKINSKYADAAQVKVHLIGYADDTGDDPVNQRLAMARAQTVQSYFLQNGIRPQELSLESRGTQEFNQPLSPSPSKMKVEVEVTVTMN